MIYNTINDAVTMRQGGGDSLGRIDITDDSYVVYGKVTCEASGYPAKLKGVELIENKSPCSCK